MLILTEADLKKFEGKTFNDFLLRERKTTVESRLAPEISSHFSKRIPLNTPIVSAPMRDITEANLAIHLAQLGGIGIIHRDISIEKQATEVKKVKRKQNYYVIEDPHTIGPNEKISTAKQRIENESPGGLLVVDENRKLLGILTKRDIRLGFVTDWNDPVKEYMTKKGLVTGLRGISIENARKLFKKHKVEQIPLVDKNGVVKGLISAKDREISEKFPLANLDKNGRLIVGAAIGATGDYLERTAELTRAGVDVIVIDINNGFSKTMDKAIEEFRKQFPDKELVIGNVGTPEAVIEYSRMGVDGIKIGIGPGGACTTRSVTGIGIPQLQAIIESYWIPIIRGELEEKQIPPLIADGGIRCGRHIVLALLGGASSVMIGTLLAGAEETPGKIINIDDERYKIYRGEASFEIMLNKAKIEGKEDPFEKVESRVPEGMQKRVKVRGSVDEIISKLIKEIKASISRLGFASLKQAKEQIDINHDFIPLSEEAKRESKFI